MGDAARQQIAATRLAKSSTQPSITIDPRPVLKTDNPGATTPITTAIAAPTAAKPAAGALVDEERVDSVKLDGGELVLDFKGKPESSRVRNRKRKLEAASILRGISPKPGSTGRGRSYTVCICAKFSRADKGGGDLIVEATANAKTKVRNAQFCGSSWTCPDCSVHIGISRGTYVFKAIAALMAKGMRVVMTTMTVPHKLHHSCESVFDRLRAAHAHMDSNKTYTSMLYERGYLGRIRVVEVTYGQSGWHVHSHDLLVFFPPKDGSSWEGMKTFADDLQKAIYPFWDSAIFKLTKQHSNVTHGVTVEAVTTPNTYLAKTPEKATAKDGTETTAKPEWGIDAEMTKGHLKKASAEGRTPWELLDGSHAGNADDRALFIEYAQASWNRVQFGTTPKLRQFLADLGISLGTDLEVVNEEPDYTFTDELEDDGDQSTVVVDRVLVDPTSQANAHMTNTLWLECVRHAVETEQLVYDADLEGYFPITLPIAMRHQGFMLELLSSAHYVPTTIDPDAPQGLAYDRKAGKIAAHFEPNVWRAVFVGRDSINEWSKQGAGIPAPYAGASTSKSQNS